MQTSGVIQFHALSNAGLQVLSDHERSNVTGVQFSFGPLPGRAIMIWDSTAHFSEVSRLIDQISGNPEVTER